MSFANSDPDRQESLAEHDAAGRWSVQIATAADLRTALAEELRQWTDQKVSERPFGVALSAEPADIYRILFSSQLAGHVYRVLHQGMARDANGLYRLVSSIDWSARFPPEASFKVTFTGGNEAIRNTVFGQQKVKDAIADRFNMRFGRRPSVDTDNPDVRVHVHLTRKDLATVSIELSNGSMHRRGYRLEGGIAPLRENVAAGVLWRAQWPQLAAEGAALLDPMCGSGTLVIEAALMLRGPDSVTARARLGSAAWSGHDRAAMETVLAELSPRHVDNPLLGLDIDPEQIAQARANARRAGVADLVHFEVRDAREPGRPERLRDRARGLLVVNLPYGQRVSEQALLPELYKTVGQRWLSDYAGWQAALLGPDDPVMRHLGLRSRKRFDFENGPLPVQLWRLDLGEAARPVEQGPESFASRLIEKAGQIERSESAQAFANRLRKNLRHRGRWARREGIACYRVYDADLPDYALAVDIYQDLDERRWVNVQEYAPPAEIEPRQARLRLTEAMGAIAEVLEVAPGQAFLRVRRRQKGSDQYQPLARQRRFMRVREGQAILRVNFTDYLDTGLFLDHRQVRDRVAELARGGRLLNLFCYTASASVRAACEGARETLSVDMSATYLDWAADNFRENGIEPGGAHRLARADCLRWLEDDDGQRFEVVFLDPPSFSSSKRMEGVLDVQRDHGWMIEKAIRRLAPGGTLLFSTNLRRFKLDSWLEEKYACRDISIATLPEDFSRNQRIRQAFEFKNEK